MNPVASVRQQQHEEDIEWLSHHPQVQLAARVGRTFRVDPVDVLRDNGDTLLNLIRVAAHRVITRDDNEQNRKAQSSSGKGRTGGSRRRR